MKKIPKYSKNIKGLVGYLDGVNRVRENVRIRDNYTCQKCGLKWKNFERRFDVHHKDENIFGYKRKGIIFYDKKNLKKLITLCHKCHMKLHSEIRKQTKLNAIPKKMFIKAVL